jgi:adenosylhomocysteine nucleosidase
MFKRIVFFILVLTYYQCLFAQAPIQPTFTKTTTTRHNPITAILGAFPPEVAVIRTQIKGRKDSVIQNIHFSVGLLNGRNVVLAQTGIGKVNAASITSLILDHFNPEEVIFSGIAGGINTALRPGDLVVATRVAYHDYGTLTPDSMLIRKTRNPFTMQENPEYFPCDTNLIRLATTAANRVILHKIWTGTDSVAPQIIKGTIVTGDVFVASDKATTYLRTRFNADATEMEGAAVGQICWQQKIPFIVIRSLSDNANSNASADVLTFYQIAANNSAALVVAIVSLIDTTQ